MSICRRFTEMQEQCICATKLDGYIKHLQPSRELGLLKATLNGGFLYFTKDTLQFKHSPPSEIWNHPVPLGALRAQVSKRSIRLNINT